MHAIFKQHDKTKNSVTFGAVFLLCSLGFSSLQEWDGVTKAVPAVAATLPSGYSAHTLPDPLLFATPLCTYTFKKREAAPGIPK